MKGKNVNDHIPDCIKIDFEKLQLGELIKNSEITSKYEVLRFKAMDGIMFCAKYGKLFNSNDGKEPGLNFVSSLDKEDIFKILKNTMKDDELIHERNFDPLFKNKEYEGLLVILASLIIHLSCIEKKNSGI
jgi:hypothetical protein